MMIFPPSTEPHVWRQAFALLALSVWTMVAAAWLLTHGVGLLGPIDWHLNPVVA